MTREQAKDRAATLRRDRRVWNVLRDESGRRYTASFKVFDSCNLAKKEVRRKIMAGLLGCVVLRKGESFPPTEAELLAEVIMEPQQ